MQEIKKIHIKDLVLWTENPRDPIDPNATDQEIADKAINQDVRKKWSLKKLFSSMGNRYDLSELPTVAYKDGKPVVYDGNRRILIGKIIHRRVMVREHKLFEGFEFPESIECNVCSIDVALEHVDRKHAESGSWDPIERDTFKHKHMGKEKSAFLILEESTGIISSNPDLNKRFVSEEIFDSTSLHKMGFSTVNEKLRTAYLNNEDSKKILEKVEDLIVNKEITTRKNRGNIINLLEKDPNIKSILNNRRDQFKDFESDKFKAKRKTPTIRGKKHPLFGKKLILKAGAINNIYSDLLKLSRQNGYSDDFPMIIRMGLRLLCELAFPDGLAGYLERYFKEAEKSLSKDEKNTLHAQNVTEGKIVSLLQSGAHGYTSTNNINQTIAVSIIIGRLLEKQHGKQ